MKKFMKVLNGAIAAIGATLVYCGVSTSDYYVIELKEPEPAHVWPMIIIGIACMLPTLISLVSKEH